MAYQTQDRRNVTITKIIATLSFGLVFLLPLAAAQPTRRDAPSTAHGDRVFSKRIVAIGDLHGGQSYVARTVG